MKNLKLAFIITMMFCSLLIGCTQNQNQEDSTDKVITEPEKKEDNLELENKIVLGMDTPTTLHPLYNTTETVEQILYLIFSPLINIEEDGTVSSNIASSWIVNDNNTAVTITLRNDVTWHDGEKLTTDDVIYTINKIKSLETSPYIESVRNINEVIKIDDTTIKIMYKTGFSSIMQTLFFPVIPEHVYSTQEEIATTIKPVGSGPYIYEESELTKTMNLKSNSKYFKGQPKIDEIEVKFIPGTESILYSFKQGLIDLAYTTETEWGKYTSGNSQAYEMISPIYEFIGINHNKVMFQNKDVRQALMHAIDREKLINLFNLDHAIITDTPISPASYLYDNSINTRQYDKEQTKLLLTKAGYEQSGTTGLFSKDGIPLSFTLLVNESNPGRTKVARQIQIMYKESGIDMNIESVDEKTYMDRIVAKQFDAFFGGYQIGYATDLSFALHSNRTPEQGNYTGYKDQVMDELLQKAFIIPTNDIKSAYNELQQYFVEQTPFISLYFKESVLVMNNKFKGPIKPSPLNLFSNIEMWYIEQN